MTGKIIQMKLPKHRPYHCDLHGGFLRDSDAVDRRGRANKYRTWTVFRGSDGELKLEPTEQTACMRCAAEDRPQRFIRQGAESLKAYFAGLDRTEGVRKSAAGANANANSKHGGKRR